MRGHATSVLLANSERGRTFKTSDLRQNNSHSPRLTLLDSFNKQNDDVVYKKSPQTKFNIICQYISHIPMLTLAITLLVLRLMSRPSVRPHAAPAKLTNLTLLSETGRRFYIL